MQSSIGILLISDFSKRCSASRGHWSNNGGLTSSVVQNPNHLRQQFPAFRSPVTVDELMIGKRRLVVLLNLSNAADSAADHSDIIPLSGKEALPPCGSLNSHYWRVEHRHRCLLLTAGIHDLNGRYIILKWFHK